MESANYICVCGRGCWAQPGLPRTCPQCGVVITLASKQKEQVMDGENEVNGDAVAGDAKPKKTKAAKPKAAAKPKKTKAAKPKAAAKPGGRPKRSNLFPVEHRITMLSDKDGKRYGAGNNPKQKESMAATRFAYYRDGMSVKSFLEKGGQIADLSNDTKKKFIKVAPAPGKAPVEGADATT
jgi:hypothetical protein